MYVECMHIHITKRCETEIDLKTGRSFVLKIVYPYIWANKDLKAIEK